MGGGGSMVQPFKPPLNRWSHIWWLPEPWVVRMWSGKPRIRLCSLHKHPVPSIFTQSHTKCSLCLSWLTPRRWGRVVLSSLPQLQKVQPRGWPITTQGNGSYQDIFALVEMGLGRFTQWAVHPDSASWIVPPTPHGKLREPVVLNWGVWVPLTPFHLAAAPQLTAPPRRPPHRGVVLPVHHSFLHLLNSAVWLGRNHLVFSFNCT